MPTDTPDKMIAIKEAACGERLFGLAIGVTSPWSDQTEVCVFSCAS